MRCIKYGFKSYSLNYVEIILAFYLWFVASDISVDWCKHTTNFTAGYTQFDANIGLQTHASALQRCVYCQMNWIITFTGIIFMDNGTMVGHLISSCPPTWNSSKYFFIFRILFGMFTGLAEIFSFSQWCQLCKMHQIISQMNLPTIQWHMNQKKFQFFHQIFVRIRTTYRQYFHLNLHDDSIRKRPKHNLIQLQLGHHALCAGHRNNL